MLREVCGKSITPGRGGFVDGGKGAQLNSRARRNRLSQGSLKIAEKQKWCFCPELFAHEKQRRKWGKQKDRCRGTNGSRICNGGDTLSESTISDLITILQERHESPAWESHA